MDSALNSDDRVYFDIEPRQVGLNRGPGRHRITEELDIDGVHRREIGHVAQVHPDPNSVAKRGPGSVGDRLQIPERLACLLVKGAFNLQAIWPKWSLASKKEQTAAPNSLGVWSGWLGRLRGLEGYPLAHVSDATLSTAGTILSSL